MGFWIPALLCLASWLGLGWWMKGQVHRFMPVLTSWPRGWRVFLGSGGLILGLAVLVGGMLLLAAAGGAKGGIQPWAWPVVSLLGMLFVGIQTLGACSLASLLIRPPGAGPKVTGREDGSSGTS